MTIIVVLLVLIYVIGIPICVGMKTTTDAKYHERGFLGAGYITTTARKATSRDARISLLWSILLILWPILAMLWLIKLYLCIFNEGINFICLLLGFSYEDTKVYKYLETKLWPL